MRRRATAPPDRGADISEAVTRWQAIARGDLELRDEWLAWLDSQGLDPVDVRRAAARERIYELRRRWRNGPPDDLDTTGDPESGSSDPGTPRDSNKTSGPDTRGPDQQPQPEGS